MTNQKNLLITIEGIASEKFCSILGLNQLLENELFLVTSFAEDAIPIGHVFKDFKSTDTAFVIKDVNAELTFVTQQYGREFPEIPAGWKVIIKLRMASEKLPEMKKQLKNIDSFESKEVQYYLQ
jgi:hypothetical protein